MIIDCISDLHGFFPELEGGDLLIVAGDLTFRDSYSEYLEVLTWLEKQDYKKKIYIAGNHDNCLQNPDFLNAWSFNSITYLCDNGTEYEGLRIWGSPWSGTFERMNPKCKAFTYDDEKEMENKFSLIPNDVDILVTHTPPFTIFDSTADQRQVGSIALFAHLITRLKPKLHVFGHIHEAYGQQKYWDRTIFVNASHVNEKYQPVNKPIRIIL